MKYTLLILTGLCFMNLTAQTRKTIDWKPCSDFTDQFKAQVDKFNAEHKDGFQVLLSCTYSGDPSRKNLPEQKIALTSGELEGLHALRKVENAAFAAMGEYENHLYRAHHIRKPEIGEPCYHFVGIVIDTDYITVDPNPMLPTEDCP